MHGLERARAHLSQIASLLQSREIERAEHWGGADVLITSEEPARQPDAFCPDPRTVVTPLAAELSWLFFRVRDALENLYDGSTKIEVFGRLANTAIRYQQEHPGTTDAVELLQAVLDEAFAMVDDMEAGTFVHLDVAVANEIADDYRDNPDAGTA